MKVGHVLCVVSLLISSAVAPCYRTPPWTLTCFDLNRNKVMIPCYPTDTVYKVKKLCAKDSGLNVDYLGLKLTVREANAPSWKKILYAVEILQERKVKDGDEVELYELKKKKN